MALRQTIDPPAPQPPAYGLVPVARVVDAAPADWMRGEQYLPYPCGGGGVVAVDCDVFADALDAFPAQPGVIAHDPFVVYAAFQCSTIGMREEDYRARATTALTLVRSRYIAAEFWVGALAEAGADALAVFGLAGTAGNSDTLTAASDGAIGVVEAIAALDWAQVRTGRRGMIHVTPQVLGLAVAGGIVTRPQGTTWVSPMGNVVVADAGYDGTGPGNAAATESQWAYASGMVDILLGPVDVQGLTPDVVAGQNTAQLVAFQPVLLRWDPCGLSAAEVAVVPPAFGGVG